MWWVLEPDGTLIRDDPGDDTDDDADETDADADDTDADADGDDADEDDSRGGGYGGNGY